MTASCCQTTETLGESIAVALREKKPVMLASLAAVSYTHLRAHETG